MIANSGSAPFLFWVTVVCPQTFLKEEDYLMKRLILGLVVVLTNWGFGGFVSRDRPGNRTFGGRVL